MPLDEKIKILSEIFKIIDISDQRTKDKIEGIIIGASLRESGKMIDNIDVQHETKEQ